MLIRDKLGENQSSPLTRRAFPSRQIMTFLPLSTRGKPFRRIRRLDVVPWAGACRNSTIVHTTTQSRGMPGCVVWVVSGYPLRLWTRKGPSSTTNKAGDAHYQVQRSAVQCTHARTHTKPMCLWGPCQTTGGHITRGLCVTWCAARSGTWGEKTCIRRALRACVHGTRCHCTGSDAVLIGLTGV